MPRKVNLLQVLLLSVLLSLMSNNILNFMIEISGTAFPFFIGIIILLIFSSYSFGIVDIFLFATSPIAYGFLCASIGLFQFVKAEGITPIKQLTGDYGLFFLEKMDALMIEYNIFVGETIINLTEIKNGFATNIYGLTIISILFWIVLWSLKTVLDEQSG